MSIRIFFVVLLVSLAGFWHIHRVILNRAQVEVEKFIQERVEREAIHFKQAQQNLELFSVTFKKALSSSRTNVEAEFNQKFILNENGTYSEKKSEKDSLRPIQMFLKKGVPVTPQMKKTMVILYDLIGHFGHAWSANFTNVWVSGVEDYGLTYWPSRPTALSNLPTDHSFLVHEFMMIGLPENNPMGGPRWTGPYFDVMSKDWMISINYPIYHEGKYLLSVGMDVLLNNFYDRSFSNVLEGTYNIVFRDDGRLITHPRYMDEIKKSNGNFFIQDYPDKTLKDIFSKVTNSNSRVILDQENDLFIGTGKIKGPGWWFVLVYPLDILMLAAKETGLFLILVGFISLLIELMMLYQVLQRFVAVPIKNLIDASNKIAIGDRDAKVKVTTDDEIGHLGDSFNLMGDKVRERDMKLQDQAARLEMEVEERTKELDVERARAYHASKMATLGEVAGGVAHEINNPLGVIAVSAGAIRKRIQENEGTPAKIDPYLDKIENTTQRISKIVKGLRAFSRNAKDDDLSVVPLSEIIENTLTLCEETMKKNGVNLECQELPSISLMCREVEIIQTLLNLIQNAIDALAGREDKRIKIYFLDIGERLSIVVEDNGHGVPMEFREKIMNPFFTTKDIGKGTGLGLFISYGLIESNRGKLSFEQSEGSTRFIISLLKAQ